MMMTMMMMTMMMMAFFPEKVHRMRGAFSQSFLRSRKLTRK